MLNSVDGAPPTPDAVRFALVTSSAIEVVWSDPVGDRADAITGYKLQFREARSDDKGWLVKSYCKVGLRFNYGCCLTVSYAVSKVL